ncbi:FeoB-associated Cys-rich membrane protein [Paenibacillus sp. alder61]|uniref:FeoB-associated Cys-rich membrane protein n=1 Tax=Paenibacillus faecis TaxID=862114 RepID=A0A5D0D3B2_9BACL|nr:MULTISPECIES: FeoB-associated Cys-rich membrane protein [Paenibacillus]MCA1295760.1 FeoB-associated Cys-rich membrane protein [Paenibacillus sp. alder61]TYA15055.1 FeoB-associated Cys-rich membrane protein [Paenibacillus faecis]
MADILIAGTVFVLAAIALYRGVRKSRKGVCASCAQNKSCAMACAEPPSPSSKK